MTETATLTDPSDLIHNRKYPDDIVVKAGELLEGYFSEPDFPIVTPTSAAASAVYLSALICNDRIVQPEIAEDFDIGVPTLRTNYQNLHGYWWERDMERLVR